MKHIISILIFLIVMCGFGVGCAEEEPRETKYEPDSITFVINECPEGWEWVDQEIYGMKRVGCYPIDFDYEKANERLAEHLAKEAKE